MSNRLKGTVGNGLMIGLVLGSAFNAFGFFPIVIGMLLGIFVVIGLKSLMIDEDIAKNKRELELIAARIEILEELKK